MLLVKLTGIKIGLIEDNRAWKLWNYIDISSFIVQNIKTSQIVSPIFANREKWYCVSLKINHCFSKPVTSGLPFWKQISGLIDVFTQFVYSSGRYYYTSVLYSIQISVKMMQRAPETKLNEVRGERHLVYRYRQVMSVSFHCQFLSETLIHVTALSVTG